MWEAVLLDSKLGSGWELVSEVELGWGYLQLEVALDVAWVGTSVIASGLELECLKADQKGYLKADQKEYRKADQKECPKADQKGCQKAD